MPSSEWPGLPRPQAPLPSEEDFEAVGRDACLDAKTAWEHFGGLPLGQAYELFVDNPINYQEDFMWMGAAAFAYYFPVIDRYLREVVPTDEDDDCYGWIIGEGMKMQFATSTAFSRSLLEEISGLAAHMAGFAERFQLLDEHRDKIAEVWAGVERRAGELLKSA